MRRIAIFGSPPANPVGPAYIPIPLPSVSIASTASTSLSFQASYSPGPALANYNFAFASSPLGPWTVTTQSSPTFVQSGLNPAQFYYCKVSVTTADGRTSAYSSTVSVETSTTQTLLTFFNTLVSSGQLISLQLLDPYSQNPGDVFSGTATTPSTWTVGSTGVMTAGIVFFAQGPFNGNQPTMACLTGAKSIPSLANGFQALGGIIQMYLAPNNPAGPTPYDISGGASGDGGGEGGYSYSSSNNPFKTTVGSTPDIFNTTGGATNSAGAFAAYTTADGTNHPAQSNPTINQIFRRNIYNICQILGQVNGPIVLCTIAEMNDNFAGTWYAVGSSYYQMTTSMGVQLNQMLYNEMVNVNKLTKILFMTEFAVDFGGGSGPLGGGGGSACAPVFPGTSYCDLVGVDTNAWNPPNNPGGAIPLGTASTGPYVNTYTEMKTFGLPVWGGASVGLGSVGGKQGNNFTDIAQPIAFTGGPNSKGFTGWFGASFWAQSDALGASGNSGALQCMQTPYLNLSTLPPGLGSVKAGGIAGG